MQRKSAVTMSEGERMWPSTAMFLMLHTAGASMRNIEFSYKCSKITAKSVVDNVRASNLQ